MTKKTAILYSGGTDSTATCVAAIENGVSEIHLLTFYESFTGRPKSKKNIDKITKIYPKVKIYHKIFNIDPILKNLMYENYVRNLFKFGFFNLCNPLQSALCWHILAQEYCKLNNIKSLLDGITKELPHLPNHTKIFIQLMREWHIKHNIIYTNPVIDWPTYSEQTLLDRIIVGQHGFFLNEREQNIKSTGKFLFDKGVFIHPNLKGSKPDKDMQQECYPFLLFNIYLFWYFYYFKNKEDYPKLIEQYTLDKLNYIENKLMAKSFV